MVSKRPPNADDVIRRSLLRYGDLNLFIYCGGDALEKSSKRDESLAVVYPLDWKQWDWRFVGGLSLTVVAGGWTQAQLDEFAEHLIRSGAEMATVLRCEKSGARPKTVMTFVRPAAAELGGAA